MLKIIHKFLFICVVSSSAAAMDCSRLSEAVFEFDSLKNNASSAFRVRNLQQIIGTVNDGQWGRQSEYAYTRYLTQCRSDPSSGTYVEKRSRQVTGGTVVDNFSFETIYEDIPVTKCEIQKLPVYQNTGTGTDDVGAIEAVYTIWEGTTMTFTKEDGGDPTSSSQQDHITDNVKITRGNSGGQIYNIVNESVAVKETSPAGTEWALGTIDQIADLTFGLLLLIL